MEFLVPAAVILHQKSTKILFWAIFKRFLHVSGILGVLGVI